jgi:hypothetical protein
MRQAPGIVRSSGTANKDNLVVYLCSPKGEIELAPDGRMTQRQLDKIGYKNWRRCEAVGAREIERISLILARQHWERKKLEKVQQHLREAEELKQLQIRCRLRRAQGFSKNDAEMNARILKRAEQTENNFLSMIATQFNPGARTTALQIEMKEQSTSKVANIAQKRQGVE